ncbi:MAG: type II toxin-antitoxin system prevent-host-death family antitoxin [Actinomycetota bacterium]|nr:type II toxin-antitoxin system prevent-host-death family antitoxin [Actinomycetota bacterium]
MRELRQNASALLERVEASGVSLEITNHGRPVAHLVPVRRRAQATRAELIAGGQLRPGRGNILDVAGVQPPVGMPSSDELLAADRGDR